MRNVAKTFLLLPSAREGSSRVKILRYGREGGAYMRLTSVGFPASVSSHSICFEAKCYCDVCPNTLIYLAKRLDLEVIFFLLNED